MKKPFKNGEMIPYLFELYKGIDNAGDSKSNILVIDCNRRRRYSYFKHICMRNSESVDSVYKELSKKLNGMKEKYQKVIPEKGNNLTKSEEIKSRNSRSESILFSIRMSKTRNDNTEMQRLVSEEKIKSFDNKTYSNISRPLIETSNNFQEKNKNFELNSNSPFKTIVT
jgi:hypothetical protein